jgi:hypothetical protein
MEDSAIKLRKCQSMKSFVARKMYFQNVGHILKVSESFYLSEEKEIKFVAQIFLKVSFERFHGIEITLS